MYDKFITNFIATKDPDNIINKCEKLIKGTYDTLCQLYTLKLIHYGTISKINKINCK